MRINVASLRKNEGSSAHYELSEIHPPLQIGSEEYVFLTPLKVSLDVVNAGKSLMVVGRIQADLNVFCSRCLVEFVYPMSFGFEDEWIPVEFAAQDEEGSALIFEKDEVFLGERILEHILLQLPMRFLCSEDCKGLCSQCGANKNLDSCACSDEVLDPRLEILSKWNKGV